VIHDWQGLFAAWPPPPDAAEFKQARADYRAELACNDRYLAKSLQQQAEGDLIFGIEPDPVLKEALRAKAESGDCPVLAEILKEDQ